MKVSLLRKVCAGVLGTALLLGAAGCRKAAPDQPKQFPVRGQVKAVHAAEGEIELAHEAIPGLMDAMTMEYKVVDPAAVKEMHPGDRIAATMLADYDAAGPKNLRLKDVIITAQASPDYLPAQQLHVPQQGDVVPDFSLTNERSRRITLNQFHGKVLLMTFIYTRCPVADYCPRISRNFAEIDKLLAADPALYAKTHLLSVSFDLEHDTPAALASYGGSYTGNFVHETFAHWDFAVPTKDGLTKMEQFFDLGVTPGEQGTLNHSLATTLIGRDGKVIAFFPTNEWTPQEMVGKIKSAAQ